jgi:tRNA(Arg) A34 adenosine deaminase TadA
MFWNQDEKWIRRAESIALSIKPCAHARLGAILVYKDREIGRGYNRLKSHPLALKWGRNSESIFIHAELDALLNAQRTNNDINWKRTTLYVCRVKKTSARGRFVRGISKPCCGCQAAIAHFDVGRFVYTTDDGGMESIGGF